MRKLSLICAMILVISIFSGFSACSDLLAQALPSDGSSSEFKTDDNDDSGEIKRNKAAETFYNSYLGLTVTAPAGWYKTYQNETNLTANPDDTKMRSSLDLYDYEDGGYEIELIKLESDLDSTADDHCKITLYADYYPDVPYEEYVGFFPDFIAGKSDDEYIYTLQEQSEQLINGEAFTRFLVEVSFTDDSVPYYEEHYIRQVAQDCYLVAYVNYWSDSAKSKSDAYELLNNCFTLSISNKDNIT